MVESISNEENKKIERRRKSNFIEKALSEKTPDYEELQDGRYKLSFKGSTVVISNDHSNIEYAIYDQILPEIESIRGDRSLDMHCTTEVLEQDEVRDQIERILDYVENYL